MKKGLIIVNGYLKTPKFMAITEMYQESAKKLGLSTQILDTKSLVYGVKEGKLFLSPLEILPDFVLFLDKDILLARHFEKLGVRVFNSSKVIACCDNKASTFQYLAEKGIAMPLTVFSPLVFENTYSASESDEEYLLQLEAQLGYPMVVKACCGSFGEQVYLVHDRTELARKRRELITIPHLYQAFVATSRGKDVRIHVVGDKIVASMLRRNEVDFRANISNGGHMQAYTPTESFCQMALEVTKYLQADFLGIDILFDKNERPILCEVNSNAHIQNIYTCTGVNVADYIMAHIKAVINA